MMDTTHALKEQMQEAMERLPSEDAAAYLEALASVSDLVQKESNPELFLLCEGGNVDNASLRLANYWKERKRVFKERAFLPMNASGEGTLTAEDVEHVKSAFFVSLPPDSSGHPVVFSDTKRATFGVAGNASIRPRTRFYFFHKLTIECSPAAQVKGIIFVRLMELGSSIANHVGPEVEHFLLRCLPMKFFSAHICCTSDSASSSVISKTILPSVLQKLGKDLALKSQAHVGSAPCDFYERLKLHGFDQGGLPTSLGGKMIFETLNTFSENKKRAQEEMSAKLAAISAGMPAQESPSALGTIPSLLQFVLGVLVMLEDKKKMKLAELLRESKTQGVLKGLLKPSQLPAVAKDGESDSASMDAIPSNLERSVKRKLNDITPSAKQEALLEKIRAVREGNAELASSIRQKLRTINDVTQVTTKRDSGDLAFSGVPDRVQFALGVLATLEEKRNCKLRDLLADSKVQLILRGLLGTGAPEVSS